MHGNRLPRPVRLRTRHSADDAQIPEHIRHIAARPAPHTYGCGTDDARSVHARRERRDAGRNALRKRPGLRQRSAHRPRNGTRVRLLSRRRGAIRSDRFPSDHRLQETVPRRNPRRLCRQTRIPTTLRRDNGTGYRAVAYGGRLGPHGRRGESGRQGDLCDHRPHAGRGSPRTDPQGTDRVSVAGRSNFPFVRLSRTWLAQRLVWDGVSAEHCSGGTHRTCGFLRTSRTTRRPAET